MSQKTQFSSQYTSIQQIKSTPKKKTEIVQNTIGQYYIAKKFSASDMYALNQIALMKTIRHPNIVQFHDFVMEKGFVYLIEEYCEEGDIGYYIMRQGRKKKGGFGEKTIAKWLLQLLLAIQYLHNKNIMHRDIRPQNIFLTSLGNLKLGSFSSSKMFDNAAELSATMIGSPYYMAPQCIENKGYDEKVDIWAFGCVLYELCALKSIFNQMNIKEQAEMILNGPIRELPSVYSKELEKIYLQCMRTDPKQRPSARSLIRQKYFLELMKKIVTEKNEVQRIPIKHYNVHFNVLAKKRKEKDPNTIKQAYKMKKILQEKQEKEREKQKQRRIHTPILPKIEQTKQRQRRSSKSFEKGIVHKQKSIDKVRQAIREKSRQMMRQSSRERQNNQKQKQRQRQRQRSKQQPRQRSRELVRKKSSNKMEKFVVYSPTVQSSKKQIEHSQRKRSTGKKIQKIKTEDSMDSPKPPLLPPPMLPRPQKKVDKKQSQAISQSNKTNSSAFSQTKRKQQLSQLTLPDSHNEPKPFNLQQNLQKVFQNLNIPQTQQQYSFELEQEDEIEARLTKNKSQNQSSLLLQTYKTKLEQLIEEIKYKYCPNMEEIQERTQQFDSNTFAGFKKM